VHVWVKPENVDEFINASKPNHEESVLEPGNMRFDVLQCKNDPNQFLLYEAYESEEAAKAHKETDHYKTWKAAVADYMARPREGVPYNVISPASRSAW
jgi:autoinducer 2-degrading protein